MKLKRILSFILASLMLLSATACGNKETSSTTAKPEAVTEEKMPEVPNEDYAVVIDKENAGAVDAAERMVWQMKEQYGIDLEVVDHKEKAYVREIVLGKTNRGENIDTSKMVCDEYEIRAVGEKVFIETYWLDTATGFTGLECRDTVVVTGESPYQRRVKATMDNLDPTEESHVSSLDVDFSTGAPVAQFDAQCLGHSNVASSEVYLDQQLPAEVVGTGMAIGRSNDDDGHINAQSYLVYMYNRNGKSQLTFAHRGGPYYTKTEVFGTGIIY